MAATTSWFFRDRYPGEGQRGGSDNFAFQMSFDTLVRETIQNSNDQRLGSKVTVDFIYEDHKGPSAQSVLDLVGWDRGLKDTLTAISEQKSHLSRRAKMVLDNVETGQFPSLTIRDSNARGLEGAEDGDTGNFVMLCRHVLVTDSAGKRVGGGSFGIGKSVIWAFSGASVAMFSSLPSEGTGAESQGTVGEPRVFGRAYLVSHKRGDGDYTSDGHLGAIETTNGKKWAVSLRGDDAKKAVAGSPLARDWQSTGTSIFIPFLDNPVEKTALEAGDVIEQIHNAVQKWFWPSIAAGLLEVRVGTRNGSKEELVTVGLPAWAQYFQRAEQATSTEPITEDFGSAFSEIKVRIPERLVESKHKQLDGQAIFCVTKITEDDEKQSPVPVELKNTVALIRGAHMVVEYHSRSFSSLLPPFVGVLKAGKYRGTSTEDVATESFLRDSEPPAHDKWDSSAIKLAENYKRGGKQYIKELFDALGANATRLLGTGATGNGKVPRRLAEMLKGGKGGAKKREERFSMANRIIDRTSPQSIKASFKLSRNTGSGEWRANCAIVLLDEQGTGRELNIAEINESSLTAIGVTVTKIAGKIPGTVRSVTFVVPDGLQSIDVALTSSIPLSTVANRSLADVKVSYQQSERTKA